jgi:tripartite-type tricarboxylate transporter receptor subunit TctC
MKPAVIVRRCLVAVAAALALLAIPGPARAETWPNRPVHLVVPFAPGGSTDVVSRLVGDQLSRLWDQPVVIDNKPGAGTNLAADLVAKSEPTGYTMLMGSSSLSTGRNLYRSLPYAIADLAPVTLVVTFPLVMVVPNGSPAHSVAEFVAFAKANAGHVSFASPGLGTTPHLAGELLKQMAGIEMTHVPYRGDAPALTDTIGGRVDLQIGGAVLLEQIRAGKVRGLAVTTAQRSPLAPELPAVAESGLPGYDVRAWFAIFVPAKTPPAVIAKVNADTARILADPAIRARLEQIAMVGAPSSPEALGAMLDSEVKKWGAVIRQANIVLE